MELDKRIKDISTIQTILRYDVNCIGCKGYFFDEFVKTKDLSKCQYGELVDITTHDDRNDLCFKAEYEEGLVGFYRFFIPEADLKPVEKKYRPYTMKEFLREYSIGESIFKIRDKRDPEHIYQFLYIGHSNSLVYLGGWALSLQDLFNYYESGDGIGDEETWQPFGVLEE